MAPSGTSETCHQSTRKVALLLSFRAFDVAIAAAVQSGLPLGEWFRCALLHIAAARSPSGTLSGELALHPEQMTASNSDSLKDLVKQAGSTLETAQNRINELCDALQGLVNLSDSNRVTDFAEVKRSLARAKEVLLASRQVGRWREPSAQDRGQQNRGSEAA